MSILVLGGTGFIGSRLIPRLVARGQSVACLDLDPGAAKLPDGVKFDKPAGEALAELKPSPKLADHVRKSRELAVAEADVGDA